MNDFDFWTQAFLNALIGTSTRMDDIKLIVDEAMQIADEAEGVYKKEKIPLEEMTEGEDSSK